MKHPRSPTCGNRGSFSLHDVHDFISIVVFLAFDASCQSLSIIFSLCKCMSETSSSATFKISIGFLFFFYSALYQTKWGVQLCSIIQLVCSERYPWQHEVLPVSLIVTAEQPNGFGNKKRKEREETEKTHHLLYKVSIIFHFNLQNKSIES